MRYERADAKQAAQATFKGLWAAVTTPFKDDGSLDEVAATSDIDHLVNELAIDGVFCTGVMGEFWALDIAERQRSVETIVRSAAGRLPILAHTGAHSAQETINLTRHAARVGADFAVVINPYYPVSPAEGLRAWFIEVLTSVDIGVWLFDTSYSGVQLPLSLIDELADLENVCGIKVGHDHQRYVETLELVGDRLLVCEANESMWLTNMRDHGQQVYMSSAIPYLFQTSFSQPMREYTDLALSGEFEKAAEVAASMEPLRELSSKWLHGQWARDRIMPIAFIKAWGGLLGMSGGNVRPPLVGLTIAQQQSLASDLVQVGLLP